MRHRVAHRKLGRVTPHRKALLKNLATALFERERIRTTLAKAKELLLQKKREIDGELATLYETRKTISKQLDEHGQQDGFER